MTGYVPESIPKMNRSIYPTCGFSRYSHSAFMSHSPPSFCCGPTSTSSTNVALHGNIYGVCPVGPATYGSFSEPR